MLDGSCTRGQERGLSIWLEMVETMSSQTGDHGGASGGEKEIIVLEITWRI